jgi:predicted nucleic acid-binding protein
VTPVPSYVVDSSVGVKWVLPEDGSDAVHELWLDILASQALELSLAFRRPAYDCFYVALAIRDGSTLVTADRALVNALGPATGRVMHLGDLETG